MGWSARILVVLCSLVLLGCQEQVNVSRNTNILSVGDSLMAWNSVYGQSIPHVIEEMRGEKIVDRSVVGALMSPSEGETIPEQYVPGDWDWVIVNGGGNDLMFGCGCRRCGRVMDKMVSSDGQSGIIPDLLRRARDDGAKVLYFGYLRSPGLASPIEACKEEGDAMDARIAVLAKTEPDIHFVSMADIVPKGKLGYFSLDFVHPSVKSSRAVGKKIAAYMAAVDASVAEQPE